MNLRPLLTVNAVLATGHGLGFIIAPSLLLSLYQIAGSAGAALMGQLFGAELLVVAIICWKARDFTNPQAITAVVLAGLIPNAVGTVISLLAILNGAIGVMGWVAVAIYVGLSAGYLAAQVQSGRIEGAA